MRAAARAALPAVVALAACVGAAACGPAPASADVLLELDAFQGSPFDGLAGVRAELDLVDAEGKPAVVDVLLDDGFRRVTAPVPLQCDVGSCALTFQVRPGRYTTRMRVTAEDRCGTRAHLVLLAPSTGADFIELSPHSTTPIDFQVVDASFDDDGDGIVNVLETAVCGRFDVADADSPATQCLADRDGCCARPRSPLEGRMGAFAGGPHARADGAAVAVDPFALDATEATIGTLERCVAAGRCLVGQPQHAARQALTTPGLDRSAPITALTPKEAAEVCDFLGKRLPTDDEWDYAAAHRADGTRGRYPWDDGALALVVDAADVGHAAPPTDVDVRCRPNDVAPNANHAARGADCPRVPVPVGSHPSTFVRRSTGAPIADMAGNVAEWTVVVGTRGADFGVLPGDDVEAVVLRGGGAGSFVELLENDFALKVRRPGDGDDPAAFVQTVQRLSANAGFRCAVDRAALDADPPALAEPGCE